MIVDVTETTVTLSWMPPAMLNGIITNYRVQYRRTDSSSSSYNSIHTWTTDLTYTVTGLSTNTEYDFRVRADNVVGRSGSSNVVTTIVGKLNAKQKHLGCKNVRANQKQHCKQAGATKRFDIS